MTAISTNDDLPSDGSGEDSSGNRLDPGELKRLHILRRVSPESAWGLLEHCRIATLEPGEKLLTKGQSNRTMYVILAGRLRVHLDAAESEPTAFIDSGQTVGEMSLIDDSPVSAHVIAASRARLLAIDEETFWRLIAASHEFAVDLLLLLAQRMRASNAAILENARLRRRLEHDSTVDALTNLYNRRWLDANLPRLAKRYQWSREPLSIAMLDVDHFKRLNDEHGHAAGDQVLSAISRVIRDKLRPTDFGARYGGEEFLVVLTGADLSGAMVAAERLRRCVSETDIELTDGRNVPCVTISIGVAEQKAEELAADLLERADAALYRAKNKGRNRVEAAD